MLIITIVKMVVIWFVIPLIVTERTSKARSDDESNAAFLKGIQSLIEQQIVIESSINNRAVPGVTPCNWNAQICPPGHKCNEVVRRVCELGYCRKDIVTLCEKLCEEPPCTAKPSTTRSVAKPSVTTSASLVTTTTPLPKTSHVMPSITTSAALESSEQCCHYIFLDTRNLTVYPSKESNQTKVFDNPENYHNWKLKDFDELDLTMLGLHEQDYYTIIRFKSIHMDISKSCYYEAQTSKVGCKYPSELNSECKFEPNHEPFNTIHLKCIRDYFNNEQLQLVKAPFLHTSRWAIKAMERTNGRHKPYKPSDQDEQQDQSINTSKITQNLNASFTQSSPVEEECDKSHNCEYDAVKRNLSCRD